MIIDEASSNQSAYDVSIANGRPLSQNEELTYSDFQPKVRHKKSASHLTKSISV